MKREHKLYGIPVKEYEKWYVCYQDQDHDMTWKNYKDEKEAKEIYDSYKGKKAARMLCKNAEVVHEDGDKEFRKKMKKYAEENKEALGSKMGES